MNTYALSANNMLKTFLACLYKEDENMSDGIRVEGFITILTFDPKRIAVNKDEIDSMLEEMPDELLKKSYWDILFPDGCYTRKDNTLWTCLAFQADQLFQLGVAVGKIDINS